jgi:GMP synthase (glutamine-hydrolysing)
VGRAPGQFLLRAADLQKASLTIIEIWRQPIPDLSSYDGLIVLGGGPNVDQTRQFPFLIEEKRAIRRSLADDRPYLGFCLGHQLLADALAARVGPNHRPSAGFTRGFLTGEGRAHPAFRDFPETFSMFKWHAQAVTAPVPGNLAVLATSMDCQIEAISATDRPHLLGLQFDNHAADPRDVEGWLTNDQKWLATLPIEMDPIATLNQARQLARSMEREFQLLIRNYFELVS